MIGSAATPIATSIVWLAVAPCIAASWIATGVLRVVHVSYLSDTVAVLAPFPAAGGAVLAALFLAAAGGRPLRARLARVAVVMFAGGAIATSAGFLVLGLGGLPRRYQQYEDAFQPLQILVGVAAGITVVGAVLAVRSARTSR